MIRISEIDNRYRFAYLLFLSLFCFALAFLLRDREFMSLNKKYNAAKTELSRHNEAVLWYDSENATYVITAGSSNGIKKGDIFNIYDGGSFIGKAKVINISEKISFVDVFEKDTETLSKTYYKASIEWNTPD